MIHVFKMRLFVMARCTRYNIMLYILQRINKQYLEKQLVIFIKQITTRYQMRILVKQYQIY